MGEVGNRTVLKWEYVKTRNINEEAAYELADNDVRKAGFWLDNGFPMDGVSIDGIDMSGEAWGKDQEKIVDALEDDSVLQALWRRN